jgi:hypothetical protein
MQKLQTAYGEERNEPTCQQRALGKWAECDDVDFVTVSPPPPPLLLSSHQHIHHHQHSILKLQQIMWSII